MNTRPRPVRSIPAAPPLLLAASLLAAACGGKGGPPPASSPVEVGVVTIAPRNR